MLALLAGWADAVWDTGIAFGTVGARRRDDTLEITTFRADAYDRASRNPVVAFGDDIAGDLVRRDFTVNAMAVELTDGPDRRRFVDPHGGLAALAAGRAGHPGHPGGVVRRRPAADAAGGPVRLPARASPRPSGCWTRSTAMAGELARITRERVQAELSKLISGRSRGAAIELLVDTGLAEYVLPEVPAMRLAIDEHMQHKDVYTHSLVVLEQAIDRETDGPDLVLRLAALLHDVGKPDTRRKEPDGRVSFHHHEVVGAKMVRRRLRELRYPEGHRSTRSCQLVYLHLRFHGYGTGEWTDSAVRRYVTDAGPLLDRLHKLVRSDCTTRNRRRAAALQRSYDSLEDADRRRCARRRSSTPSAPTWTATQIMRAARDRPRPAGGPGLQAPAGAAHGAAAR